MAEAPRGDILFDRYLLVSRLGRSPWYHQYLATDTKRGETVAVKRIQLPAEPGDRLAEFQAWYSETVLGAPGVLPVRAMHLQGDTLFVVEQPPEGTPWRNWVGQRPQPGTLLPRVRELLERMDDLHRRRILHNCLLPENLWWHPRSGWTVADCGWLRWCFLHGYAPAEGNPPEAWTPMADGHQLGALIAYTLLGIDIANADLPLRATTELKRRARKLPHPWPNLLLQLWGPPVTEEWSPLGAARMVLEAPPGSPVILTAPAPAVPAPTAPRTTPAEGLPITGSIATAAAISAAAGNPIDTPAIGSSGSLYESLPADQREEAGAPGPRRGGLGVARGVEPDIRQRRKESSRLAAVIMTSLVLTFAFALGILGSMAAFLFQDTIRPTTVPDVTGLTVSAAKKKAEPTGFAVIVNQEEYSAEVPTGKIVRQSPSAGTTVKALRDIFVSVSRGARTIKLPSVVGLEEKAATKSLEDLNLKVGTVNYSYTREAPAGRVIDQNPSPNTMMAKEEPVHL
ncbi:MAG TPA: PASTA domain-containing protein, partial [bacterium]|nr:PASTA domain-containing protein [bacterium]